MKYLTTKELCETLEVHRNTVLRRCRKGMPHLNIGGYKRFDLDQVLEWLNMPKEEKIVPKKKKKSVKKAVKETGKTKEKDYAYKSTVYKKDKKPQVTDDFRKWGDL